MEIRLRWSFSGEIKIGLGLFFRRDGNIDGDRESGLQEERDGFECKDGDWVFTGGMTEMEIGMGFVGDGVAEDEDKGEGGGAGMGCSLRFREKKLNWGLVRERVFKIGCSLRLGWLEERWVQRVPPWL